MLTRRTDRMTIHLCLQIGGCETSSGLTDSDPQLNVAPEIMNNLNISRDVVEKRKISILIMEFRLKKSLTLILTF